MPQLHLPAPSPAGASLPSLARLAMGGALLFLVGCTAPGMKLAVKADARPTTTDMGGLKVTLRRLDPQSVVDPAPARADAGSLADLVADAPKPYLVGPQDVLIVTVWDHPEITLALGQFRTDNANGALVEEDGKMFFPHVGRIKVAGLSVTEVRERITQALARTLQNPQVDVKVLAFRSQKVFIGGEVKTPAVYNVTDVPFNLPEALNRAGGLLPTADDSRITITRGDRTYNLDVPSLLGKGVLANRIYLKDGDTLHVPSALENPVYVMGELVKPGTLPMIHGRMSLAKALSDAGGISGATSDARSVYVIRQGASPASAEVFHLDVRNPTAMVLADKFNLRPRDIVYVDAGTIGRFSRVMNLLLPAYNALVSSGVGAAEAYYFRHRL